LSDTVNRTRPAVFLDRDGTINVDVNYLSRPEDLQFIPGAARAMARLRDGGYSLVVVTNQSAVARGLITEADLGEIHRELQRQLRDAGAEVDGVYYCPHHPEYGSPPYRQVCVCRKPNPGLLERAALELGLDLEGSYMVGDSLTDLQAGWNAGCGVVLVLTGCGTEAHREADAETLDRIDYIAGDLSEAADWIVGQQV
jgi:D-glycero-D-manno-heptose 1,7-bisphosphate phosphatase